MPNAQYSIYVLNIEHCSHSQFSIACCSYNQQFVLYIHIHTVYVTTYVHVRMLYIWETSGFVTFRAIQQIVIYSILFARLSSVQNIYNSAIPCEAVAFLYMNCSFLSYHSSERAQVEIYVLADGFAKKTINDLNGIILCFPSSTFFVLPISSSYKWFASYMAMLRVPVSAICMNCRNMYECAEN